MSLTLSRSAGRARALSAGHRPGKSPEGSARRACTGGRATWRRRYDPAVPIGS